VSYLELKNTYSKQIERFTPLDPSGKVTLYSCGPTVYSYAHIGNFRTFLLADVLRRVLEQRGYTVRHVMNITDVGHMTEDHLADATGEDKLARAARELGWDPYTVAAHFERAFAEDAKALRLKNYAEGEAEQRELHPRATEHVPEMLAMIQTLLDRGHAYIDPPGQVYFEVRTFADYGKLSGKVLDELESGARVAVRAEKRDPRDFALWKVDSKHLMQWNPHGPDGWAAGEYERLRSLAPSGIDPGLRPGFPGWHIECSAMARSALGPVIDLHTGGEDNVFPHHECEIAQSFGARTSPEAPSSFCRYWVHARHLLVNGRKMSKRDGTLITAKELFDPRAENRADLAALLEAADFAEGRVSPQVLRLALISTPFTQQMNFTVDVLVQARAAVDRFQALYDQVRISAQVGTAQPPSDELAALVTSATAQFRDALDDNLNMSRALAELFRVSSATHQREMTAADAALVRNFLEHADEVFAVLDHVPRGGKLSKAELTALATELSGRSEAAGAADSVPELLALRHAARAARNFARADELRQHLTLRGVEIEDLRDGVRWRER
jgi:cysteinyl-tRNA synthetase